MKTDAQIQKDVMDQLRWDPFLSAAAIGVAVKDGVVTLSGQVDSYARKIEAERSTLKVAGVKAIAEEIQIGVSPTYSKSDADIASVVVNTLRWAASVPEDKIRVKVENGNVILEGEVDWDFERAAARQAIEPITGVRTIQNRIGIRPRATAADVRQRIISEFQRAASIDATHVSVEVDGNTATLRGTVRSYAEKEDAEKAAWRAQGITRVDNKLEVSLAQAGVLQF